MTSLVEAAAVLAGAFRVALAFLLVGAGLDKVLNLPRFVQVVGRYGLAPSSLAGPLAGAIVAAELGSGAGLLTRAGAPLASCVAAVLLITFAAAIAVNLRRGRTSLDCGCRFGAADRSISPGLAARNLILAAGALASARFDLGEGWRPALVAWVAGGVFFLLYLTADLILAGGPTASRRVP